MNKGYMAVALLCVGFLSGCNEKTYDSEYYFAHQDEAKIAVEKCKAGEIADDNCTNAKEALQKQAKLDWMRAHGGK